MSLLFCDSFDDVTSTGYKWDFMNQGSYHSANANRHGGFGLEYNSTNHYIYKVLPQRKVLIAGVAYRTSEPTNWHDVSCIIRLCYGDAINYLLLDGTGTDNRLRVVLNGSAIGYGTDLSGIPDDTWTYYEVKFRRDATNGGVWVRRNGVDDIRLGYYANPPTTLNTGATDYNNVQLGRGMGAVGGYSRYFDDFYVCDDQGSTNNDFLGDIRVEALFPTGTGQYAQFTPSPAVDNYLNVDEVGPDSETSYNYTNQIGEMDTFAMGNVTATSGTIYAVQTNLIARKTDAGNRSLAPVIRQSGSDGIGTSRTLGNSYNDFHQCYDTQPVAGGAWTVSAVNAMEVGYKMTG